MSRAIWKENPVIQGMKTNLDSEYIAPSLYKTHTFQVQATWENVYRFHFFLRPEEAVKNLFPSSSRTCCRAVKLHEGCRNICNYFDVPQIAMFWTPFKKTNKAECMYTVISLRDGVKLHFDELASSPYSPPRPLF